MIDFPQLGKTLRTRTMTSNTFSLFIVCCALLLSACDQRSTTSSVTTTTTPPQLRAIDQEQLRAEVTIDGRTTSYYGQDFPDGNWIIYLKVELGKDYPFTIEWFTSNVLVLIQTGTLNATNFGDIVSPALTNSNTDPALFDADCDNKPNLDEVRDGEDPLGGIPGCDGTITETAPKNVIEPADFEQPADPNVLAPPNIGQQSGNFTDLGIANRVTRFSQPIRVHTTNANRASGYGATLWTSDIRATVSLRTSLNNSGKEVLLAAEKMDPEVVVDVTVAPIQGADCESTTRCSTAFEWKEQHWYELIFEEDAADTTLWQASVRDLESQEIQRLGTIITPANTVWNESSIGLGYQEQVAAATCSAGLPPITLHFLASTVNGQVTTHIPQRTPIRDQNCVRWGSGASTTTISGDPLGGISTLTFGMR